MLVGVKNRLDTNGLFGRSQGPGDAGREDEGRLRQTGRRAVETSGGQRSSRGGRLPGEGDPLKGGNPMGA